MSREITKKEAMQVLRYYKEKGKVESISIDYVDDPNDYCATLYYEDGGEVSIEQDDNGNLVFCSSIFDFLGDEIYIAGTPDDYIYLFDADGSYLLSDDVFIMLEDATIKQRQRVW